ncbi:MAG: histidinol dehydrogenase [Spirochaetota bacterium]
MKIIKMNDLSRDEKESMLCRFGADFIKIMVDTVIPIVNDVRSRGDAAVKEYTRTFDGIDQTSLLAGDDEIDRAHASLSGQQIDAFCQARENIEEFHLHQKRHSFQYERGNDGIFGIVHHPIEKAAIYVPGGKAAYPSSVLMGAIPAMIAGVKDITIITPPRKDGAVSEAVLGVCKILGIKKILKAGGAQGIAAAGLGTESVSKADIIVGPGNVFVTAAKSYLFSLGVVQIDSMAGPSETLIIADEGADPKWVAFDLLSQAEHEENAKAVLVTPSEKIVREVTREIEEDLARGEGRIEIKRKTVANNLVVIITKDIEEAVHFSNEYAPEHMQMMVAEPMKWLPSIRNVGSLFLGYYSPVAVGDYYSGTNHVLPTGGAARFSSGLSVETFMRRITYQSLTEAGLRKAVGPVQIMSKMEGFDDKHGGSVSIRFEN